MTSPNFTEFVKKCDNEVSPKRFLLLLDKCISHPKIHFQNIDLKKKIVVINYWNENCLYQ